MDDVIDGIDPKEPEELPIDVGESRRMADEKIPRNPMV